MNFEKTAKNKQIYFSILRLLLKNLDILFSLVGCVVLCSEILLYSNTKIIF